MQNLLLDNAFEESLLFGGEGATPRPQPPGCCPKIAPLNWMTTVARGEHP